MVETLEPISVIVTSCKHDLTTLKSIPEKTEVIITRKKGLGFARNYGASQAHGNLLIFLDDDLTLNTKVWQHIFNINLGEFGMTHLNGFPCTRVLAIHQKDFWRVGGFDLNIKYTGEDRDFFIRALQLGLKYKPIPLSLVTHIEHKRRDKNIHVGIACVKDNVRFMLKHWRICPRRVLHVDWLNRMRRGQGRTILLQVLFLVYFMLKGA